MSDSIPFHHRAEDGSRYEVEVILDRRDDADPHYDVDLVRSSIGQHGLALEQRLTLAEYPYRDEAEDRRMAVEDTLSQEGLAGLGDAETRITDQPYLHDGIYVTAVYPPDAPEAGDRSAAYLLAVNESGVATAPLAVGERDSVEQVVEQVDVALAVEGVDAALRAADLYAVKPPATPLFDSGTVRHVDGGGTAHWFDIVPRDEPEGDPYELRYFRALQMPDDTRRADSYPVMPLADADPADAGPLSGLERYLEKGDVFMAQQFAHDVADVFGEDFPEPLDLPALDPRPEYYFGYGVGPDNAPSLEAVKTWMDGSERRFDTLTVGEYTSYDDAAVDERELERVLEEQGIEAAMNRAERLAVAGGYLDPQRDDPRIFLVDDAPPDMFMTERQRELNIPAYGLGAVSANGESFLDVVKSWGEDGHQRLVIPQPDWETAQATAHVAGEMLERGHLQEAMRLVELAGMEAGMIDTDRADRRLFTEGPPDPFETLAQQLADEINPYWNTDGEAIDEPETAVENPNRDMETLPDVTEMDTEPYTPVTLDEAIDLPPESAVANPYWRLETLPVNDPAGEPLGYALHIVVYDGVEHDPEQVSVPEIPEDAPFRLLEMAHFETTEAADKFGKEFHGYLMPGLLEGPELAQEVARLEEQPVEWKTLAGDDLKAYQNSELKLTRDAAGWHPYNPNAERDDRIEAEGLYHDPICTYTVADEFDR